MQESQSSAQVAALNELGIKPTGVQVFQVTAKTPAFGVLEAGRPDRLASTASR